MPFGPLASRDHNARGRSGSTAADRRGWANRVGVAGPMAQSSHLRTVMSLTSPGSETVNSGRLASAAARAAGALQVHDAGSAVLAGDGPGPDRRPSAAHGSDRVASEDMARSGGEVVADRRGSGAFRPEATAVPDAGPGGRPCVERGPAPGPVPSPPGGGPPLRPRRSSRRPPPGRRGAGSPGRYGRPGRGRGSRSRTSPPRPG